MGYTHYWKLCENIVFHDEKTISFRSATDDDVTEVDKKNFAIAFEICRNIVEAYSDILAGPHGDGDPIISEDEIIFNGIAENDEDHEPFFLYRDLLRNSGPFGQCFCKTARKPYDEVVVLCLWVCARLCHPFEFDSDGGDEVTLANASFKGSNGTVTKGDYSEQLESMDIFIHYSEEESDRIEKVEINGETWDYYYE
jgi:hypothetical protein